MAERGTFPRWARWTAAGCTVAVLGAGTYLVVDALPSQAATTGMRVATVSTGSVTQSVSLSGSVARVDQLTATFRTAGTVKSVRVAVGDEVEAGDVLATMETTDLVRAVTVAQANLVAAQASLDAAGSSTSATTTSSTSTSGSGSTPTPSASPSASPSTSPSSPARAPTVDTSGVHRAVADYDALVQAAVTTCQPVVDAGSTPDPTPTPSPSPTASPSPSPTASPSPSPSPSGTSSDEPSGAASPTTSPAAAATATVVPATPSTPATDDPTAEQVTACIGALSSALTSAQHTASEMDRLAKALDAAAKALQEQQSKAATQGSSGQTGSTGTSSVTTAGTGSASATGTGTGTGGTGGSAGGSQTTASLEVAVLKATQVLAGAEQDLDGAVLKAPISGRVGQVDLVKGEPAGTSSGVVVVGPGAAVVTVDLPLAQLGRVRVSQDVTVTPAGTTDQVPGLVQSIGVLPSSTTTSTPTYPVRVTVSDAPVSLASGSMATVSITLATATDVLTVPVSAVTGVRSGTGAVQVLSGGTTTSATVTVGAVGQGKVQVEKGLTAGQVVVLADPTTALPSGTANTTRRSTTSGVGSLTGSGGGMGGPPGG